MFATVAPDQVDSIFQGPGFFVGVSRFPAPVFQSIELCRSLLRLVIFWFDRIGPSLPRDFISLPFVYARVMEQINAYNGLEKVDISQSNCKKNQ